MSLNSEENYELFEDQKEKQLIDIRTDETYTSHRKQMEAVNFKVISKLTKISIFCLIFMLIQLLGGYMANSLAIMTDAAHLFSDLSGFIVSIISLYIATRPANFELTYGYHRAEVVGALASILFIWVLTIWLVKEAIDRIINPTEINELMMLCISITGLIFNLIMGKILSSEDLPDAYERSMNNNLNLENNNDDENNNLRQNDMGFDNTSQIVADFKEKNDEENTGIKAKIIRILCK